MSEHSKDTMTGEESFILLSLKEKQSKKLAQVFGSDTCRTILEYMASKDFVTETDIAHDLQLPLSTVHYNIKALHETRMLTADEFHYSEKGKEVPHYKLANKFIVIAPQAEKSVMDQLRKFVPISVGIVAVGAVFTLGALLLRGGGSFGGAQNTLLMDAAPRAFEKTIESAPAVVSATLDSSESFTSCLSQASAFPWIHVIGAFLVGVALTALTIFLLKKCRAKKRVK